MATNPLGEGKAVVSANVPQALAAEIERRAKRLKWTKSKYAGELLQRWFDSGCPAVSEDEAVLLGSANVYPFSADASPRAAEDQAALPPVPKPPATG